MALTKMNFYIGFLFCYIAIISTSAIFMNEMQEQGFSYSNDTAAYVTSFDGFVDTAEIDTVTEANLEQIKSEDIITQNNETGEFSITDFLANINYYSSKTNKISGYIKLIYNSPSFVVYVLGIPYEDSRHIINLFGVLLFIAVLLLLIREVRGS